MLQHIILGYTVFILMNSLPHDATELQKLSEAHQLQQNLHTHYNNNSNGAWK